MTKKIAPSDGNMPITWRKAVLPDLEQALAIQTRNTGAALVGPEAAMTAWRSLASSPFFASAVLEANPPIAGETFIGFGASVIVSREFAEAEISDPRPDINSRLIAALVAGRSVLATPADVALANATDGVTVLICYGNWRAGILNAEETREVHTLLATSFTTWHAGFRIRRILQETSDAAAADFLRRSIVYRKIANFRKSARTLFEMTKNSAADEPGSIGNVLFHFHEPVLRLRNSDQQLLRAALTGSTDHELAAELGLKPTAVKARWRSAFARISEAMPGMLEEIEDRGGRGPQKRHRVLAYVREHPEELRPYRWKRARGSNAQVVGAV